MRLTARATGICAAGLVEATGPRWRSEPYRFLFPLGALLGSLAASVVAGVGGAGGEDLLWLHDLGRSFIQQGLFTGLVLGVGSPPGCGAGRPRPGSIASWHGSRPGVCR